MSCEQSCETCSGKCIVRADYELGGKVVGHEFGITRSDWCGGVSVVQPVYAQRVGTINSTEPDEKLHLDDKFLIQEEISPDKVCPQLLEAPVDFLRQYGIEEENEETP